MHLIAAVKSQDQMDLFCPDGLMAKGFSWYYVSLPKRNKPHKIIPGESLNISQKFSICINCKPEKEGPYQWIEICYANNENTLGGQFVWKTQSCDETPFAGYPLDDSKEPFLKICQAENSIYGLTLTTGIPTLKETLSTVISIPCPYGTTDPNVITKIKPNNFEYDIDLACPKNYNLLGFERFFIQKVDSFIPVLSAVCQLNDTIKKNLILIYAKGKLNDSKMLLTLTKYFSYSEKLDCATKGTRCNLKKRESNYCGLRWNSTFYFLNCTKTNKTKPETQKCPNKNIQYIYIIIGVCSGLFILLLIVMISYLIRVKKVQRYKRKKADSEINTISKNPYYDSGQLEDGSMMANNNPYYEVNNVEIVEMSRNPYYGTDQVSISPTFYKKCFLRSFSLLTV